MYLSTLNISVSNGQVQLLGFPANENVREKMRKFSFVFHDIKNSAKTIAATINCAKKLGEFYALRAQR